MAFKAPVENPNMVPQQPETGGDIFAFLLSQLLRAFTDPTNAALIGGPLGVLRGQSSRIMIEPSKLDPKRFMTVSPQGKSWGEQAFPHAYDIVVQMPPFGELTGPYSFREGIKGLNPGHALRRAADNWVDADVIRIIGKEAP